MRATGPMVFGILIVGAIVCGLALWVEFTFAAAVGPCGAVAAADLPSDRVFLRLSKSALLVLQYKHKAGEGRLD